MKHKELFKVRDHAVTGEEFELLYIEDLEMLETCPQPSLDKLPEYYKSDDYISHSNFKRNLFERVYHIIRIISLKRKLRLINSTMPNDKCLLDIGCGTGDFLLTAIEDKWNAIGIEPNEKARYIANNKTNNMVFGAEKMNQFQLESFDVITLWHSFEHIPEFAEYFNLLKKLLKSEGTLIIAVPNFRSYDALFYKNFWAGFDVPRHLWHFSRRTINELARRENMKVIKVLPLIFDAYYVSLLSEKYKKGKMNLMGIFVGWYSNLRAKLNGEYSSLIYVIKKH